MAGEIAEMMLDGTMCSVCGEYLGEDAGYPVTCGGCSDDVNYYDKVDKIRRSRISRPLKSAPLFGRDLLYALSKAHPNSRVLKNIKLYCRPKQKKKAVNWATSSGLAVLESNKIGLTKSGVDLCNYLTNT